MGWYVATQGIADEGGACLHCQKPIKADDRIYFLSMRPLVVAHGVCAERDAEEVK